MKAGPAQEAAKRKPGTFVKGDPRINRTSGPRSQKPRPSALLMDMRAVYRQDESQDRGPAQKALRKLFQENLDSFLARLARLEAQAESKAEKQEQPDGLDEGHKRAKAEVRKCLERLEADEARKNAEFAQRPDAAEIGANLQKKLAASLEREAMLRRERAELRSRASGDQTDG